MLEKTEIRRRCL